MPLTPINESHALQIQAGIIGRKTGHKFEDALVAKINELDIEILSADPIKSHIIKGCPAVALLNYVVSNSNKPIPVSFSALSTGALATSEDGKKWLEINGVRVKRCKSDIILNLEYEDGSEVYFGISSKQCNNQKPTNAQLYFTTAVGFCRLLRENGLPVPDNAEKALRQFCGDIGYRPSDHKEIMKTRLVDPRRYFWEEILSQGKAFWEELFNMKQDEVTTLLLQKAYLNDPFIPDFLIHKTRKSESWGETEVAIYSISELVKLSKLYSSYNIREYSVRKGSHKDPIGVKHEAPRFGIVQMQRGGQAQHPTQLQFNLQAGYFYKIKQDRS